MKSVRAGAGARRKDGLTISALEGEILVYDHETRRASCLNSFAAEVLELCDGRRSAASIARDLPSGEIDERMVWLALADLQKARLLEDGSADVPGEYSGTSRRDLLKKIGLGTAIAVPVVTGLSAPALAQVATCGGVGTPCSTGSQGKSICCPGLQCTGQADFKQCQ